MPVTLYSLLFLFCFAFASLDVSVLLCWKEQVPLETEVEALLHSIPFEVNVYFTPFLPELSLVDYDRLLGMFPNLHKVPDPTNEALYANAFECRKFLLSRVEIQTKYIVLMEYGMMFSNNLIELLVSYADELRDYEQKNNLPKTAAVMPFLLEYCDKPNYQFNHTHAIFNPKLFPTKNPEVFALIYNAKSQLPWSDIPFKMQTEFHFDPESIHYINYLEDHLYLVETEFYLNHLEVMTIPSCAINNDAVNQAFFIMIAGHKIAMAPFEAYIKFFCHGKLEFAHVCAWRRLESSVIYSFEVQKQIFSFVVEPTWMWGAIERDKYLSSLFTTLSIKDQPNFDASHPKSSVHHANLLMAGLLMASKTEFNLVFDSRFHDQWNNDTQMLRDIYTIYQHANITGYQDVKIRARMVYNPPPIFSDLPDFSEEIKKILPRANNSTILHQNLYNRTEVNRTMPPTCLYMTEEIKNEITFHFMRLKVIATMNDQLEDIHYIHLILMKNRASCSKVMKFEGITLKLVEEQTYLPFPSPRNNKVFVDDVRFVYLK